MSDDRPIRVLVIDDSAFNRQTIASMLESDPGIQVVARAADGDHGLQQAFEHRPDVITLDLEMPKMGGFTFLRILMRRQPTPVLIVSSHSSRDNVFKALELGALDFIAKPTSQVSPELRSIRDDLVRKVRACLNLSMATLAERARKAPTVSTAFPALRPVAAPAAAPQAVRLCALGASTGGPPALQQILGALDPSLALAVLITQHMPPRFTGAFAERLGRSSRFEVVEAKGGERLRPGLALVAPGWGSLCLERRGDGFVTRIEPAAAEDRFVPSVDRMLMSAAEAAGPDVLAVILTGMGGDGGRGVRTVKDRGGQVLAEAPETAIIFGMPQEAIATGAVDEIVPLGGIADAIARFGRRPAGGREGS
ncbi:MAG TPA: chemotaxis-specific protein-glutamate methyltransferase CheB [Polyangia bacterium]|jgi:two-component system chemotaxis response regulator CheB